MYRWLSLSDRVPASTILPRACGLPAHSGHK